MTIENVDVSVVHTANGVSTQFAFGFRVLSSAHLAVYKDAVLQVGGYTVTGVDDPDGGSVTFSVAPANGASIRLQRITPIHQTIDYTTGEKFPSESHERALDRGAMISQELDDEIARTLRISAFQQDPTDNMVLTESAATRAGRTLAFTTDGHGIKTVGSTNLSGSGAANRIAFWSSTLELSSDPQLLWDTPGAKLKIAKGAVSTELINTGTGGLLWTSTAHPLQLGVNGASVLTIESDTRLVYTGTGFKFSGASDHISTATSDGADNSLLQVSGGGAAGTNRGAYINLHGNEHASAGKMQFFTGIGAGGGNNFEWYTDQGGGATEKMRLTPGGALGVGGTPPSGVGLFVKQTASAFLRIVRSNDANGLELVYDDTAGYIYTTNNVPLNLRVNNGSNVLQLTTGLHVKLMGGRLQGSGGEDLINAGGGLVQIDRGSIGVIVGDRTTTGIAGGEIGLANSKAVRWMNAGGTSHANFGINGGAGDDMNFDVPQDGAGFHYIFAWAGNTRLRLTSENSGGGLYFDGESSADHAAPGANSCVLYIKDNGFGKTQLMARFASGAAVQVAIEP